VHHGHLWIEAIEVSTCNCYHGSSGGTFKNNTKDAGLFTFRNGEGAVVQSGVEEDNKMACVLREEVSRSQSVVVWGCNHD
jgi:hypothetical protein